jgi:preprotein translocase subunit SecG
MSVVIVLFTTLLVLLSAFVVLVILMQKPSANAGMGSALGGGAAEQAFGGSAANVLTKTTIFSVIGFFVISFGLYLGNLALNNTDGKADSGAEIESLLSGFEEPAAEEAPVAVQPTNTGASEAEAVSIDDLETAAPDANVVAEEESTEPTTNP